MKSLPAARANNRPALADRLRVTNLQRQQTGIQRSPAWMRAKGFRQGLIETTLQSEYQPCGGKSLARDESCVGRNFFDHRPQPRYMSLCHRARQQDETAHAHRSAGRIRQLTPYRREAAWRSALCCWLSTSPSRQRRQTPGEFTANVSRAQNAAAKHHRQRGCWKTAHGEAGGRPPLSLPHPERSAARCHADPGDIIRLSPARRGRRKCRARDGRLLTLFAGRRTISRPAAAERTSRLPSRAGETTIRMVRRLL